MGDCFSNSASTRDDFVEMMGWTWNRPKINEVSKPIRVPHETDIDRARARKKKSSVSEVIIGKSLVSYKKRSRDRVESDVLDPAQITEF